MVTVTVNRVHPKRDHTTLQGTIGWRYFPDNRRGQCMLRLNACCSKKASIRITGDVVSDPDAGLFGTACVESKHALPPTIVWEVSPPDGSLQGGMITLRVHAIDSDSNHLPVVSFMDGYVDIDGDPTNDHATIVVDTHTATHGTDRPLPITAVATNVAGIMSMSTRTFQIDNTAPVVTLDSSGL